MGMGFWGFKYIKYQLLHFPPLKLKFIIINYNHPKELKCDVLVTNRIQFGRVSIAHLSCFHAMSSLVKPS